MARNSEENEDLRVRRTRKLLLTALMELTIQKGFNSVTVKDICDNAMVNRATFYRHYTDKYDLLDQYMDELYELLDQSQGEPSFDRSDSPPAGLVRILEHLRGHADFYRAMLGPKGYPLFEERIRFYMEKRFHLILANLRWTCCCALSRVPGWGQSCGGWRRARRLPPNKWQSGLSRSAEQISVCFK